MCCVLYGIVHEFICSLCLVHIWPAMGLRSPYLARNPLSVWPREDSVLMQEAAVRYSYGFTGSAASTILFSELYKFEKS